MDSHVAVQDTYPEDFAHCYGCGRHNQDGHHLRTYLRDDNTITEFDPPAVYTGAGNFAYGGIIASITDCHSAGSAALFWMRDEHRQVGDGPAPRFVTARLELDFVAPTPLDHLLLTGRLEEIGERKVVVATELRCGDEVTAKARAVLVKIAEG